MSKATATLDDKLAKEIGDQVSADLSMIIDREMAIESVSSGRATARVSGEGSIHLSFKIEFIIGADHHYGCLLMPLADAIAISGFLMVMSVEEVEEERSSTTLSRSMKDAMLEVGNFVGGSSDAIVRKWTGDAPMSARFTGCQGVAPGLIPNFTFAANSELIVARLQARLSDFPPFEMILMLPAELVSGAAR